MLSGILRWSALWVLIWLVGTACAFMLYGSAFVATPTLVAAIICTVVGGLIATLVHEAGHAVAALACGWRVVAFSVRPIGLHVPSRRLVWLPREHRKDLGGYVASVPTTLARGTIGRWMWIVAGGPAASLLFAAIALISRET